MTSVRLAQIGKDFGALTVLRGIELRIEPGELFFLLGPSGCGKSTLLRMIAGLQEPTTGRIFFNDKDVTALGTERRNAVMCFQSYALWPHMTVRENICFGLTVRKTDSAEAGKRIDEVLQLVKLKGFGERRPNALSGGQQQRAALARALVVRPDCLLLDEPLSNLDAKLRVEMRGEIRSICKSAGCTTIYVTHDQKEALSVADRIALLNNGRIAQVGTPEELYHRPATSFVADFLGAANLIAGKVQGFQGEFAVVGTSVGKILARQLAEVSGNVFVCVRPERARILEGNVPEKPGVNRLAGKVVESAFLGEITEHLVAVGSEKIRVARASSILPKGTDVTVEFDANEALILPP